jgi:hypothetical protein
MCHAATTADPGAVDNRRPPVRRRATLPIRGPRERRAGLRRAPGARRLGGPGRPGGPEAGGLGAACPGRVVAGVVAGCVGLAGCVGAAAGAGAGGAGGADVAGAGRRGRRLAALHGPEDRTAVPLEKVSGWMRVAVVDTEDARFWRHGGVDWLAVARAAARDLEHGRVVEGGRPSPSSTSRTPTSPASGPCGASSPRPGTPGGWSGTTASGTSSRPASTPCTSARGPTGWRRPPRPTSRPGPPG